MTISKLLAGCLLLSSATLSAIPTMNTLDISGGYRQDDLKISNHYLLKSDHADITKMVTQAKHVNIWQIGVKGLLIIPEIDCLYEYRFLRNVYIKGYGYWGSDAGDTHFNDDFADIVQHIGFSCGSAKSYTTTDWQVGAGYLFDMSCWCGYGTDMDLSAGIVGGYSWSEQKACFKHNAINSGGSPNAIMPDHSYNGATQFNKWLGGWLGADIYCISSNMVLNLGYEYHWSAFFSEAARPAIKYWDRRHSNDAIGNVLFLDVSYTICHCWEIGAGLKWSRYTAKDNHIKTSLDKLYTYKNTQGRWQSWQLTANIGTNY